MRQMTHGPTLARSFSIAVDRLDVCAIAICDQELAQLIVRLDAAVHTIEGLWTDEGLWTELIIRDSGTNHSAGAALRAIKEAADMLDDLRHALHNIPG